MSKRWKPIATMPIGKPVLIGAEGETPTTAILHKPNDLRLVEVGGYAGDSDPSFEPTHWATIPRFNP